MSNVDMDHDTYDQCIRKWMTFVNKDVFSCKRKGSRARNHDNKKQCKQNAIVNAIMCEELEESIFKKSDSKSENSKAFKRRRVLQHDVHRAQRNGKPK